MSRWTPCKRQDLIAKLRALGFEGPYAGSRHQYMTFGKRRLILPSYPEISVSLLRTVLRQAESILGYEIALETWERV